jgi:hypothetical protein
VRHPGASAAGIDFGNFFFTNIYTAVDNRRDRWSQAYHMAEKCGK